MTEQQINDTTNSSDEIINPFNGSCKVVYEQIAAAVLNFTPKYASFNKPELNEESVTNLKSFFSQYKRRFFDRRCLSRPIYTFDHDEEGNIVYDDNDVPVLLCHTYSKGTLKSSKRLLYKEALDGVLRKLHYTKGVDRQPTCLPGGINALSKSFNDKFVFKGNFNIIKSFLASCSSCRVNKPLPTTTLPPPVAIRTFKPHSRLQCDLIDMAPKKRRNFMQHNRWGYRYILTVKCCFSKFCWLFLLKSKTANEVYSILNALFHKENAPSILQSDNGGEFVGGVVKRLAAEMNIKRVHGRPYHPQSQGQVENLNKQVKKCLARFLQRLTPEMQSNVWPVLLSGIADFLNSQWHSTIDDVPFRVYKNREPICQASHIVPDDEL